jgi:hypothetical protein
MKQSELRQIIKDEVSKVLNENINIDTKGDNKPSMSLINKKINGVDTTMVEVKNYFYHNGVIQDKEFLMKLQDGFAKVWDDLTSNL